MKNINIIRERLQAEFNHLDSIKYKMFSEIADASQKIANKANRRAEKHVRNIQLLTRIIEDHNINEEIAELTR